MYVVVISSTSSSMAAVSQSCAMPTSVSETLTAAVTAHVNEQLNTASAISDVHLDLPHDMMQTGVSSEDTVGVEMAATGQASAATDIQQPTSQISAETDARKYHSSLPDGLTSAEIDSRKSQSSQPAGLTLAEIDSQKSQSTQPAGQTSAEIDTRKSQSSQPAALILAEIDSQKSQSTQPAGQTSAEIETRNSCLSAVTSMTSQGYNTAKMEPTVTNAAASVSHVCTEYYFVSVSIDQHLLLFSVTGNESKY